MATKAETGPGIFDAVKLVLAAAVLVAGVAAYYYFGNESILLRVVGVLVALGLSLTIAFQSLQGRELWRFIQASRVEMRKVVWPTRQETLQTTLMVFLFVFVMGVFFWLLDMLLLLVTRFITGQGS